ncbi:MAG: hypothetical protein QOG48_741 [Verrucomicrobiota bacterium]|jgi:hypothetical protein
MKDRQVLLSEFEQLLPLAIEWATAEEARVLTEGVALSENELADARAAGVKEAQRIRLLRVESVPIPAHPQLRAAAETVHFLTPETRGLTLRYGIFVRWDCWQDRHLLAHEFGHTAQYERLGGIAPFLQRYLMECLTIGYANAPMELEVAQIADRICAA